MKMTYRWWQEHGKQSLVCIAYTSGTVSFVSFLTKQQFGNAVPRRYSMQLQILRSEFWEYMFKASTKCVEVKNRQVCLLQHKISERKCFSQIDWLKVVEGKWTCHRIVLSDFYHLPLDDFLYTSVSGPSFIAHRSFFCGYIHSILLILPMKKPDWWPLGE